MVNGRALFEKVKFALLPASEEDADFEAAQLVKAVCGLTRNDLLLGREVPFSIDQEKRLDGLTKRRLAREPLQYLLGEWDFYGRTFFVGEGVLIPRADTEPLVDACLSLLKGCEAPRILDLCSGTGCIGITLALERPDAQVWALEKSQEAFHYLEKNNAYHQNPVRCVLGDALDGLPEEESFDLIVSNPPYLTGAEMAVLQPEVQKEPSMALYGAEDGLFFYKELTRIYASRLQKNGILAYEIGMGQEEAVSGLLALSGMSSICQTRDLHGIIRVVTARKI